MLYSAICRMLGKYFLCFSAILLIPLVVSIFYEMPDKTIHLPTSATYSFAKTLLICLFFAVLMFALGRHAKEDPLHRRESIFLVVLIWFLTAAVAALPFLFTQKMTNPVDAYFESMSGLTTTGPLSFTRKLMTRSQEMRSQLPFKTRSMRQLPILFMAL